MTSRRLLLLTLALAMPLRAAYDQGSSTYGDTARVRQELAADYVRTNAKQFHIRSLGCDIQSLTVRADTAVCSVCGSEVR